MTPPSVTQFRVCAICQITKPATTEFFYRKSNRQLGLEFACKTCAVLNARALRRGMITVKANRKRTKKRCTSCYQQYPGTTEFFYAQRNLNGLRSKCKKCLNRQGQRYYKATPELQKARGRKWRQANKNKVNAGTWRYRANKRGVLIENVDYDAVLAEHGWTCHICGGDILCRSDLNMDHVIPLSRGGTHAGENIRPAHQACNIRKSNRLMGELDPA